MEFWDNLDTLNSLRFGSIGFTVFFSILSLILVIRTTSLRKEKDIRVQIDTALLNAKAALITAKNYESKGILDLLHISSNSPYEEVRDSAKQYLDDFEAFFRKKAPYPKDRIQEPNWRGLNKITLEGIEKQFELMFDKQEDNLFGRCNMIVATNLLFGTDFKVYEFAKAKEWYESNEYLKIFRKAKEMSFD